MEVLYILLLNALDGDKAHIGALGGFCYALSIVVVILVTLNERFDVLRCNQLHLMPQSFELSGPVVGTTTGFLGNCSCITLLQYIRVSNRNQARLKIGHVRQQLRAL